MADEKKSPLKKGDFLFERDNMFQKIGILCASDDEFDPFIAEIKNSKISMKAGSDI